MARSILLLAVAACLVAAASAFTGASLPALRSSCRSSPLSIFMGRKPATVGKGAPGREKKKRERTSKGVGAIIKVKKVTGVDMCKDMVLKKVAAAKKDNFAAEIFSNQKLVSFMTEEAGSSMYPMLMRKIKFTAKKLGVSIPDRWAYTAKANAYQRNKLAEKEAAKNAPAEEAPAAA